MAAPGVHGWPDTFLHYLRVERQLSPHTLKNYRRDLETLHAELSRTHHECWDQLTEPVLRRAIAGLHGQGLSGRSLQRLLSATRSFYRFLAREGWVQSNPATGCAGPPGRTSSAADTGYRTGIGTAGGGRGRTRWIFAIEP